MTAAGARRAGCLFGSWRTARRCSTALTEPLAAGAMDEHRLRQMHPLQALLQTLLPWVNAGQVPNYAADEAAAAGPANGPAAGEGRGAAAAATVEAAGAAEADQGGLGALEGPLGAQIETWLDELDDEQVEELLGRLQAADRREEEER